MAFPFEITYKKRLTIREAKLSNDEILEFFRKDFSESGADLAIVHEGEVIARNRFFELKIGFGVNLNRWVGVGSAHLRIKNIDGRRVVIYKFNVTRIIVMSLLAGIFIEIYGQLYWLGLIVFGIFATINWVIKIIQHRIAFSDAFYNMAVEHH
jgi:hypothetical protein